MALRSWRLLKGPAAVLAGLLLFLTPQVSFAQWWEDDGLYQDEGFGIREDEEDSIYDEGLADPMGDYYDEADGGLYEDYGGYYEDEGLFGEEEDD